MSTGIEIQGTCAPGFAKVRDAFAANFADGKEVGASFALALEGEIVVDLWGGFADAARSRSWEADTLVNTYSTTKGMAATVVGVLADEGLIDYDARVADYWPEFAAAPQTLPWVAATITNQP